jgi:hypothetical protein
LLALLLTMSWTDREGSYQGPTLRRREPLVISSTNKGMPSVRRTTTAITSIGLDQPRPIPRDRAVTGEIIIKYAGTSRGCSMNCGSVPLT